MKADGTIDIAAPPDAVWAVIIDPTDLAACVPGRQRRSARSTTRTFEGIVRASVGPIDGDFSFRSVLARTDFPNGLVVDVEGTDSMTKSRVDRPHRGWPDRRAPTGRDHARVSGDRHDQGPARDHRRHGPPGDGRGDDRPGDEVPAVEPGAVAAVTRRRAPST